MVAQLLKQGAYSMSVRKRAWKTGTGETKEAWVVDYFDQGGNRRHETFEQKADAKRREAQVRLDKSAGKTVALNGIFKDAAERWLEYLERDGREPGTLRTYRGHLDHHLLPIIGRTKLSKINHDVVENVRNHLLDEKVRTRVMAAKVFRTFKSILRHHRMSHLAMDVRPIKIEGRTMRRLAFGKDMPSIEEIARMASVTEGDRPQQKGRRALLMVAAFCGLRASEIRGLRWSDIDLDKRELRVERRADRFNNIGNPKSASGRRTVPFSGEVRKTLREWQIAQPARAELVFATRRGKVDSHSGIRRLLLSIQRAAGVSPYGPHSLRHFFISWCVMPQTQGGRGIDVKTVSTWAGHSSITLTLNVYAHLMREPDRAEIDESTAAVLNAAKPQH
jgi:integrase